jgi:hypothetical protein
MAGYVNEQTDFARSKGPAPVQGVGRWQVLVAAHDTLHHPEDVLDYWRRVLPEAAFCVVEDGGRLMALNQPDKVVAALNRAADGAPGRTRTNTSSRTTDFESGTPCIRD